MNEFEKENWLLGNTAFELAYYFSILSYRFSSNHHIMSDNTKRRQFKRIIHFSDSMVENYAHGKSGLISQFRDRIISDLVPDISKTYQNFYSGKNSFEEIKKSIEHIVFFKIPPFIFNYEKRREAIKILIGKNERLLIREIEDNKTSNGAACERIGVACKIMFNKALSEGAVRKIRGKNKTSSLKDLYYTESSFIDDSDKLNYYLFLLEKYFKVSHTGSKSVIRYIQKLKNKEKSKLNLKSEFKKLTKEKKREIIKGMLECAGLVRKGD